MKKRQDRIPIKSIDTLTNKATVWIGSTTSIVVHTLLFITIFTLVLFGISLDTVLLVLTTAVSLEAIYLAIFIQRSVNLQTVTLVGELDELEEAISDDIDETESALMKDLDETEKNISDDIDQSEAEIAKDINETEQGIFSKTPIALGKPLDDVRQELRQIVREEIQNALNDNR